MLGHDHFYNGNIRKIITVFGALFNDLHIAKPVSGGKRAVSRVPLAYAPRDKFLARCRERGNTKNEKVALILPRMGFEVSDLSWDPATQLNRNNSSTQQGEFGKVLIRQAAPYNLTIDLVVMSRSQDEALQVVEQILPFFNPDYIVTVKGLEGPESITDIPFTLNSVTSEDSYVGALSEGTRTVLYTFSFTTKVKFRGPDILGPAVDPPIPGEPAYYDYPIIRISEGNVLDFTYADNEPLSGHEVHTEFEDSEKGDGSDIIETHGVIDPLRVIWTP